jgi:hypothetical protein
MKLNRLLIGELLAILVLSCVPSRAEVKKPMIHPVTTSLCDGGTLISIGGVLYCCTGHYICTHA